MDLFVVNHFAKRVNFYIPILCIQLHATEGHVVCKMCLLAEELYADFPISTCFVTHGYVSIKIAVTLHSIFCPVLIHVCCDTFDFRPVL